MSFSKNVTAVRKRSRRSIFYQYSQKGDGSRSRAVPNRRKQIYNNFSARQRLTLTEFWNEGIRLKTFNQGRSGYQLTLERLIQETKRYVRVLISRSKDR
jgi:hypothetical protein